MPLLFTLLLAMPAAFGAEISLYAIKAPVTIDWSTPRSLFLSTLRSYMTMGAEHKIGHVYVGFKCGDRPEVISGMTSGPGFTSRSNLFREGHGLSVMLQDNPGKFQDDVVSREDIEQFKKSQRMGVMRMEISEQQCEILEAWHNEYSQRSPIIYGGLARRPLVDQGAGCTAYVMSFFEIANIEYQALNQVFQKTVYIPRRLLGGDFGDRQVSLRSLSADTTPLARPSETAFKLDLYDPMTMLRFIRDEWNKAEANQPSDVLPQYERKISKMGKAPVVEFRLKPAVVEKTATESVVSEL